MTVAAAQFGADSCDNDLGTLESPSGTVPMFLGASRVTVADPSTQQSYEISGDTLFDLISGATSVAGTPADFLLRAVRLLCCMCRAGRSSRPSRSGRRDLTRPGLLR